MGAPFDMVSFRKCSRMTENCVEMVTFACRPTDFETLSVEKYLRY